MTFTRVSCSLALALLLPSVVPSYAQPSWYRNSEKSYPTRSFLVGRGETARSTEPDPTYRLQLACDNARADLIRSIRTHIKAEFASQVTEFDGLVDAYTRSRVVSTVSLEVDGIEIVKREDSKGTSYALGRTAEGPGKQLHRQKLADLNLAIHQGMSEARSLEEDHQTEAALRAYLRLCPLLARRDETQAVLRALGDLSQFAFQELETLDGTAPPVVGLVAAAIDRLTSGTFATMEDAAAALAFRLSVQLETGQRVLVRPFTYGETQFSSPLSRYLARVLDDKMVDTGLRPVHLMSGFDPRGSDLERELSRQSGADILVRGSYLEAGGMLKVFAQAVKLPAARKVAAAQVELDTSLAIEAGLDFRPQNFQQAMIDAGLFGKGELLTGSLRVETWTDRGVDTSAPNGSSTKKVSGRARPG